MAHHNRMNYKKKTRDCMRRWRLAEGWELLIKEAERIDDLSLDDIRKFYEAEEEDDWSLSDSCRSGEYEFAKLVEHLQGFDYQYDFWKNVADEKNYMGDSSIYDRSRMNNGEDETIRCFINQTFSSKNGALLWISLRLGDYGGGVCAWGEGDYEFIGLDEQRFWDGKYRYHVLMISDTIQY